MKTDRTVHLTVNPVRARTARYRENEVMQLGFKSGLQVTLLPTDIQSSTRVPVNPGQ